LRIARAVCLIEAALAVRLHVRSEHIGDVGALKFLGYASAATGPGTSYSCRRCSSRWQRPTDPRTTGGSESKNEHEILLGFL
jgi:hypothetical protein